MIKEFIQLIYPNFCSGCKSQLQFAEKAICLSCLIEIRNNSITSSNVTFGRHILEHEIYLFKNFKNKLLKNMIHEIKYKGNKLSAYILGMELGYLIKNSIANFDLIVPIPVSKSKRQVRGFNQCELIAEGVSEVLNLPILTDYLIRNNNLNSQVNSTRYQRWLNVENQYKTQKQIPFKSKVLLIDDVVTSGATISSCVKEILEKKTLNIVSVAALAGNKII